MRIPASSGVSRAELRSPDPTANPYIAYALIIYAALEGIERGVTPPAPADINLFTADDETISRFEALPKSIDEAAEKAAKSDFIKAHLPETLIRAYCERR